MNNKRIAVNLESWEKSLRIANATVALSVGEITEKEASHYIETGILLREIDLNENKDRERKY